MGDLKHSMNVFARKRLEPAFRGNGRETYPRCVFMAGGHGLSFLPHLLALGAAMLCLCGPLHGAEIKLIPQLSIRDQYNDNIFYDSRSDDKVHDLVAIVSPALRLTGRTERLNTYLQSTLKRTEYREQKDLEATDHFHSGGIGYALTQNMNVSADARYARDSQIDRDIETTGLVTGAGKRNRRHYGCSADSDLTEKTSLSTSYSYERETFDDPEYSDSTSQRVLLSLSHNLDALLTRTTVRISPGYALYDYPDTEVTSYSLMAGATRRITEVIDLSADLGSQVSRTKNIIFGFTEQRDKTHGLIGQVALSYRGESTRSSISYYRDYRSVSGDVGLSRYSSARFNISRRFTYECLANLTAEYAVHKQDEKIFVSSDIDETIVRIQPGLTYDYSNELRFEVSYRLVSIKDHDEDSRVAQNLFAFTVTWKYPIPR